MADVGTVIHPTALGGQILGRSILGIAHAIGHRWIYDQRYGVGLAKRFYNNSPPTILDVPLNIGLGRRRPARSGNAGRRARHRRTSGRGRLHVGAERDFRRARRRGVRPLAGSGGSHRHSARHQEAGAVPAHGKRVGSFGGQVQRGTGDEV